MRRRRAANAPAARTGEAAAADPGRSPEGIRAGNGRFFFDLASVNHIEAGPAYSTANGSLVSGERIMLGLMQMPKGTGARPHSHPNEQWIYVLEGTVDAEVDGVRSRAGPGTLVYVPANAVHRVVATPERDVLFLTAKDTSHGIWGTAADASRYGPHYEPGHEPKKSG